MTSTRRTSLAWWPVTLAVLAAVAGSLRGLVNGAEVLVHRCVTDGTAGTIGLRLALVRHDAACDSGLAVGGDSRQVMAVVVLVALPVLAAHLAGAAAAVGLLARALAVVRVVLSLLAGLLGVRPRPVAVPARARLAAAAVALTVPVADPATSTWALRGPPPVPA